MVILLYAVIGITGAMCVFFYARAKFILQKEASPYTFLARQLAVCPETLPYAAYELGLSCIGTVTSSSTAQHSTAQHSTG